MIAEYPRADESLRDASAEAQVNAIMDIVRAIRNLRAESGVTPDKKVECTIVPKTDDAKAAVQSGRTSVEILAKVSKLDIGAESPATGETKYVSAHLPVADIYIPLAGLVDVDKEIARLTGELAGVEKDLARSGGKLSNEQFLSKAAAPVVEKERRIVRELTEKREKLQERLAILRGA
jgi:valyl-tRNA synthetase